MPKSIKLALLSFSVLVVLAVFLGVNARSVSAAGSDAQQGAYKQIDVYGEVLQHIQTDYVEDPNMSTVTGGALRGLLESLDADSSYLSPADYKAYKADRGGKAQVGINISKRAGYAVVVSVVPGSPADKSNISDGDFIEAIGAQDTRDLPLAMIQHLLEGAPGSQLTLAVVRPSKAAPDKVILSRIMVSEPPVNDVAYENGSILDLQPEIIDREHVNQIEAKLKAAAKSGTEKKVILDLRDVAAGDMEEGIRLANLFLKSGTIATLQGQRVSKQTFTADASKAIDPTTSMVVLVNRGTAGPAELAAGAIEDNKRGQVVGEKTFGEGAQQKTFDLPDGGAVILSIAKYASPAGKPFESEGITPDVLVASNFEQLGADDGTDASAAHTGNTPKKSSVQTDDQLNKALEILKGKAA
ncbi:MAG: S41 family peptidase [Janthinobacterium lividum]